VKVLNAKNRFCSSKIIINKNIAVTGDVLKLSESTNKEAYHSM
jgi:hypothetical protein